MECGLLTRFLLVVSMFEIFYNQKCFLGLPKTQQGVYGFCFGQAHTLLFSQCEIFSIMIHVPEDFR